MLVYRSNKLLKYLYGNKNRREKCNKAETRIGSVKAGCNRDKKGISINQLLHLQKKCIPFHYCALREKNQTHFRYKFETNIILFVFSVMRSDFFHSRLSLHTQTASFIPSTISRIPSRQLFHGLSLFLCLKG